MVLLGWAGLSFLESSLQELTPWIQGAVPKRPLPARNTTHYLVLKGRHRSFLGAVLCNPLARWAPNKAPPKPAQLHRSPLHCWHLVSSSRCAWSISEMLDWAGNRTDSTAPVEPVFQNRASPRQHAKQ